MKKFVFSLLSFAIVALLTFGCEFENKSNAESEETIKPVEAYTSDMVRVYVDEKTGVNYLIFTEYRAGGICPRYDIDGNLYITERSDNNDGK